MKSILRRCVSVSALLIFWPLLLIFAPALLGVAFSWDVIAGHKFGACRAVSFFLFYMTMEVAGVAAALGVRLRSVFDRKHHSTVSRYYRLQHWWGDILARGGIAIFGLNLSVRGTITRDERPIVFLVRHVSVLDTLLAVHLLSHPLGLRLRYVLKKELLWDPCLDLVGSQLPNCFVTRTSNSSESEIAGVRALADDLGEDDGVLIYPEGTRFTVRKRAALLRKYHDRSNCEMIKRINRYRNLLPPRLGGTLALLEARPDARVVICAHRGFEPATSLAQLFRGSLIGQSIDVEFREVARPRRVDRETLTHWLLERWDEVDEFVGRPPRRSARVGWRLRQRASLD